MTFAFLLTLAALLIVGYFAWRLAVRLEAAETTHVEESAALMAENQSLRMQRDSAQADLALTQDFHEYNTDVLRQVAAERDELQTVGERTFAMPTLAGNLLDLLDQIAAMEDGERIDFMEELAAEHNPFAASVTSIGKGRAK